MLRVAIPIRGTRFQLAYASDLGDKARAINLGGWTLDILRHYEPTPRVLTSATGPAVVVDALPAGEELLVAAADGAAVDRFSADGRHLKTHDALTGVALYSFEYSANGWLERVTDVDGGVATVERDEAGRAIAITGPRGTRTELRVDEKEHLSAIVGPGDDVTLLVADANGLLTERIHAGARFGYAYDGAGRLTRVENPEHAVTTLARTDAADGYTIRTTSALGRVTTHTVTRAADGSVQRTITGPSGVVDEVTLRPDNSRLVSLADGTTIALTYGPDPRWGWAAPVELVREETTPSGRTLRAERQRTAELAAGGDPLTLIRLSAALTMDGRTSMGTYDAASRTMTTTTAAGRTTIEVLDERARVVRVEASGMAPITISYDQSGRLTERAEGLGTDRRVTTYLYDDALGEVTMTDPSGAVRRDQYDARGQLIWQVLADGSVTSMHRNADGLLVSLTPPGGTPHSLGYTRDGRLAAYRPPPVGVFEETRWVYNADGNLSEMVYPDGVSTVGTFDGTGRQSTLALPDGALELRYDAESGLRTNALGPYDVDLAFDWDGSLLRTETWSGSISGEVTRTYDSAGRISGENAAGAAIELTYDADEFLVSAGELDVTRDQASGRIRETDLDRISTARTYNEFGEVVGLTTTFDGAPIFTLEFTRVAGRVSGIRESRPGQVTERTFEYDASGRLAVVTVGDSSLTYAYDPNGNRLRIDAPGSTVEATFDDQDRLLTQGGASYEFGADGALLIKRIGDEVTSYRYDRLGNLLTVTPAAGAKIDYSVDARGRRVAKLMGGQPVMGMLYGDGLRPVAQLDSNGNLVSRFVYADSANVPAYMTRDGQTFAIITDHLGSVRLVVESSTGAVAQELDYDAFGKVTRDTNPGFQPFGFAGGLYDPDTGLVRFGARDYDADAGRWTARDPIGFEGEDTNLYRYAAGDPVNHRDPTGYQSDTDPPGESGLCWLMGWFCDDPPDDPPPGSDPPGGGGLCGLLGWFCDDPPDDTPLPPPPGGSYCHGIKCGKSHGEPHVFTTDGVHYEFQAAGEFIALVSTTDDFEVQVRQEPWKGSRFVSMNTAVAMNVAGDRVGIYHRDDLELRINGEFFEMNPGTFVLPQGGRVELLARGGYEVTWPDGSAVRAFVGHRAALDVFIAPADERSGALIGLFGNADGDRTNDLATRDGTPVAIPFLDEDAYRAIIYGQFGNSWRISQEESLFDYGPSESTETFTLPDFPDGVASLDDLDGATRAAAEALCRAAGVRAEAWLDDCILDVGLTGEPGFALSAAYSEDPASSSQGAQPIEEFPINIGDTVDVDLPARGAGQIETAGAVDRYTFRAPAGQAVYLQRIGPDPDANLVYRVEDALGVRVPGGGGSLYAGGGEFVLEQGGRYVLTVSGAGNAVGPYGFRLWPVPADQVFPIALGDSVAADQPAAGAGRIQSPGAVDRFTFEGAAGESVYLQAESCSNDLRWIVLDPAGGRLPAANTSLCRDIGPLQLEAAGGYTIEVRGDRAGIGQYSFRTWKVPVAERFAVVLGDTVGPDQPSSGAGRVDSPGAADEYAIAARVGDVLHVEIVAASTGCGPLRWTLVDPHGAEVLSNEVLCVGNSPPPIALDVAGQYILRVFSFEGGTGEYSLSFAAP